MRGACQPSAPFRALTVAAKAETLGACTGSDALKNSSDLKMDWRIPDEFGGIAMGFGRVLKDVDEVLLTYDFEIKQRE